MKNYSRDEICVMLLFQAMDMVCGEKTKVAIQSQYLRLLQEYDKNEKSQPDAGPESNEIR